MDKKLKLNLSPIKVQSFVTTLNDKEKKNVVGGVSSPEECTTSYEVPCTCGGSCQSCEPCESMETCEQASCAANTCIPETDICTVTICTLDPVKCKTMFPLCV